MNDFSYITLLSSDDFLPGVLMLDWSLKRVHSRYALYVVCSTRVSNRTLNVLRKKVISYHQLNDKISFDPSKINTKSGYSHWNNTFDKLYVWKMTQFKKVVYLDSDMQVIRNIDFLFDKPHMSSVQADKWNEPGINKLNSGLIVIEPNEKDFNGLRDLWYSGIISLSQVGDQDIIREYYSDWGCDPSLTLDPGLNVLYSEVTHGVIHKDDVSPVYVIHYIGFRKPWMVSPRAIVRRAKHNFLARYLVLYYIRYCFSLLSWRIRFF